MNLVRAKSKVLDALVKKFGSKALENPMKFIDAFIYGGLAVQGALVTKDIRGALIGPIALKLATGANLVAGVSGVATLAVLGLASATDEQVKEFVKSIPPQLRPSKTPEEIEKLDPLQRWFFEGGFSGKKVAFG